jgi:hypothetical protein
MNDCPSAAIRQKMLKLQEELIAADLERENGAPTYTVKETVDAMREVIKQVTDRGESD